LAGLNPPFHILCAIACRKDSVISSFGGLVRGNLSGAGEVNNLDWMPVSFRLGNAVVSYVCLFTRNDLPAGLAIPYWQHPWRYGK